MSCLCLVSSWSLASVACKCRWPVTPCPSLVVNVCTSQFFFVVRCFSTTVLLISVLEACFPVACCVLCVASCSFRDVFIFLYFVNVARHCTLVFVFINLLEEDPGSKYLIVQRSCPVCLLASGLSYCNRICVSSSVVVRRAGLGTWSVGIDFAVPTLCSLLGATQFSVQLTIF